MNTRSEHDKSAPRYIQLAAGRAVSRVRPVPHGLWSRNAVRYDADFAGTLENAARQAMADQLAVLLRRGWQYLQRAWWRLTAERRGAAAPLNVHGSHC